MTVRGCGHQSMVDCSTVEQLARRTRPQRTAAVAACKGENIFTNIFDGTSLTQHTVGSTDDRRCSLVQETWLRQEEHLILQIQERTLQARRLHLAVRVQHWQWGPAIRWRRSWAGRARRTRLPSCSSRPRVETRPRRSLCSSGWPWTP